MTIELGDLTTVDQTDVNNQRAILAQRLRDANPAQDYRRGVLGDLLLERQAVVEADAQRSIARYKQAQSLLAIDADPTLADTDTVDNILSNWNLSRIDGAAAGGEIALVVSDNRPATVSAGTIFSANGMEFVANANYAAKTDVAAVITATDRLIQPVGDGTYMFTIFVTATSQGSAGMLRRGDALTSTVPIRQLLKIYVHSDFTGGIDDESNSSLVLRLRQGAAMATWGGRENIDAMLHTPEAFPEILQTSIVGYGDPEMSRDQVSIFPISGGGRSDLYVRTQELPKNTTLRKTCTLVEKVTAGGIWQFSLGADEVPALYDLVRISRTDNPLGGNGYAVVTDTRSMDLAAGDPDINDALQGVYSRYQTATFRFLDTDTPVGTLTNNTSTAEYEITARAMPQIAEIQDFVQARKRGPTNSDVLVKAAVPCTLGVSITLAKNPNQDSPDTVGIQNALAKLVNTAGFIGKLTSAQLADAIHDYLLAGQACTYINMTGKIRAPSGELIVLNSPQVITIPDRPADLVTGRTVVFILDPQDVVIAITALGTPEI